MGVVPGRLQRSSQARSQTHPDEYRWHEEDVAGRVLEQIKQGVVRGRVISIPAIAEDNDILGRNPGEYLWDDPDGYNYGEFLRARQRESIPMMWSALYQQRPAPEEGEYFKVAWLRPYTTVPAKDTLAVYGASDYAVTANGGDYTVHVVVGVDPDGRMYLLDLWRKQASSDEWVEAFCGLVKEWKPREWAEEQGQIKAGVGPFIERMQRERQAFVYRRTFPTRGDKAVRAQSIRGRMALHGLYVPQNAPWVADLRSELLSFPAGKHDDQVDGLGLIGQLLDTICAGHNPRPVEALKPNNGYRPYDFGGGRANEWLVY
jgi:predicted phage terminase large subunit-like protein